MSSVVRWGVDSVAQSGVWLRRSVSALLPILMVALNPSSSVRAQVVDSVIIDTAHANTIRAISLSNQGAWVASIASDRAIKLWSSEAGANEWSIPSPHRQSFSSATFNSGDSFVLTAGADSVMEVDVETAERSVVIHKLHTGESIGFTHAAYSPDESIILTADGDSLLEMWNASTGELIRQLHGHTAAIYQADFSDDGRYIVSASFDSTARVWDATDGSVVSRFKAHYGQQSADFSALGNVVYSASIDTIYEWEAATGALRASWRGIMKEGMSQSTIRRVEVFGGGDFLATNSDSGIAIWRTSTRELVGLVGRELGAIIDFDITEDGRTIVATLPGNRIRDIHIWRLEGLTGVDDAVAGGALERTMSVAPNPATDQLSVRFGRTLTAPFSILVVDLLGRTLHDESFDQPLSEVTIDLASRGLPAGAYYLVLKRGEISEMTTVTVDR